MSALALFGAIAPLLALVLVGVALRAFGVLERAASATLNAVIVYAALPALIFVTVARAPLSWELLRVAAIAWAVSLAGLSIAWELSHRLHLPSKSAGAFVLVAALGNTGYIGYPVVRAILGEAAMPSAVFYDVFGTVAVAFTVGIAVAARRGEHEGPINPLKELITFPAMIAMLVALVYRFIPLPAGVSDTVMSWLGIPANMAVPLMMISLGVTLDFSVLRGALAPIGAASGIKLLLLPALAVAIATVMKDTGSARLVALQAGMPSMMLTLVIGQRFKLDTGLIAAVILVTTVASVVTLPLIQLVMPG